MSKDYILINDENVCTMVSEYAKFYHAAETAKKEAEKIKTAILEKIANPSDMINYSLHGTGEYTNAFFLATWTGKTIGYPVEVAEEIATLKARLAELEKQKIVGFSHYTMKPDTKKNYKNKVAAKSTEND